GDLLWRRAAAGQHRPRIRRGVSDPPAGRAQRLARRRQPTCRHRPDPRGLRARRRRARMRSRCRRPSRGRHLDPHAYGLGRRMKVFTNGCIVTRRHVFSGTVTVERGTIRAVERETTAHRCALDFEGDYLLPGAVELHTDVLERHAMPRPGVEWPVVAAVVACDGQLAGAGITTVLDSLAIGYLYDTAQRPRNPRPLVEAIRHAKNAGALRADHFLHMRCEVSTEVVVDDFAPFAADPMVRLVSLMDHSPGQRQFMSVEQYRHYNQGRYGLSDTQVDELV